MNILQVNTSESGGGAERAALSLHAKLSERGHGSWLAVGRRKTSDSDVFEIPGLRFERPWSGYSRKVREWIDREGRSIPGAWRLARGLSRLADGGREIREDAGIEEFDYPGSRLIARLPPVRPDLIHLHNLHGNYFDLSFLPRVTAQYPCVVTAHDEWLMTGHCAYSFDCVRWATGCGQCPDLSIYPAVKRDGTASNWRRKEAIYSKSVLHVVAPSRWLRDRLQDSMLSPASLHVIPYGIDLNVFAPFKKSEARRMLGLREDDAVCIYTAAGGEKNPFKDYETVSKAVELCRCFPGGGSLVFLVLGGRDAGTQIHEGRQVRKVPFLEKPSDLVLHYSAADCCLIASKADNLPFVVMESLACGTPVIATAVGGIAEEVDGLDGWWGDGSGVGRAVQTIAPDCERAVLERLNTCGIDHATGILIPKGDARTMACALAWLFAHRDEAGQLSRNAAYSARVRYDLNRMVAEYEQVYTDAITDWMRRHPWRVRFG